MIKIYLYTLGIAFFSTLLAAVLGLAAAFFTSQRNFPGRRLLLSFSVVPLCIPPLIIALGYVCFWGVNGTVSNLFGTQFTFLYTTLGIIIVQGFYNFPLVTGIVTDAWSELPVENENAARLLGASERRILFSITLPRLRGAISAACIPVFLYCFFSFMIVLLFSPVGKSTLEVEIYHSIRTTLNLKNAVLLAGLETLTSIGIVFIYSRLIKKSQITSDGVSYLRIKRTAVRGWREKTIFTLLILFVILFFICPFLSILKSSFIKMEGGNRIFSFNVYGTLFGEKSFWLSVKNTFLVGIGTAFLCCCTAFIYAVCVKINGKQNSSLLQTIPLIPMAVSSVVLAWVFGLIFHRANAVILVLIQTLLYWPLAYRQIQSSLNRISWETDRAAVLLSKNKTDSIKRVYLPACKKVIFSSFCYCFAVSAGDATLPLVLSIPKFNTLALYTYRLAASYRFNAACACGIILIFLSLICKNKNNVI